jgi:hypothetical protein
MCLRVGGGINLPPSKRRFSTSRQHAQKCEESGLPLRAHCKGFSHENGRITLRGVNPLTISFSDRLDRIAGHTHTSKFIPMWSQAQDSFLSNPPNAILGLPAPTLSPARSSCCGTRDLPATTFPTKCES